jgi:class 3 adenylate cyclase
MGVAVAGWTLVCFAAARHGVLVPLVPGIAGMSGTGFAMLGLQVASIRKDKTRVEASLGAYLPRTLVKSLLESGEPIPVTSQHSELTIFFSDIRGFTKWMEGMDPDEVTGVINEYFTAMAELADRYDGILERFMGHRIMVFFGAPTKIPDHPLRAVTMALEMQRVIERLNSQWAVSGRAPLEVGMGINTAVVTVGNLGSKEATSYTVIGRGVNIAAGIESWAPPGWVLVSARTRTLLHQAVGTRLFAELNLDGILEPVPVFKVQAGEPAPTADSEPDQAGYWIVENGRDLGPFQETGMDIMRQCGRVGPSTAVKRGKQGQVTLPVPAAPERCQAFICYRRAAGSETAWLIRQELLHRGIRTFLDVEDLSAGRLDETLLQKIEKAPNFIVILTPDCLSRCAAPDDWLRREIEQAIHTRRNIIPILKDGFEFPPASTLPATMASLHEHPGVRYNHELFPAMVERIVGFLKD